MDSAYRNLMALGIRLACGRRGGEPSHLPDSISAELIHEHPSSNRWDLVWWSTLNAFLQAGVFQGNEQETLQATLTDESHQAVHPLVLALAEAADPLVDVLMPSTELWLPQASLWWGKGPRKLSEVELTPAAGQVAVEGARAWLVEILRSVGPEGERLSKKTMEEPDIGSLLAPWEGAAVVPLGAMFLEDSGPPWRIQGPDPATCKIMRRLARAVWVDRCGGGEAGERTQRVTVRADRKAVAPALPLSHYRVSIAPLERGRQILGETEPVLVTSLSGSNEIQHVPLVSPGPVLPDVAIEGLRVLVKRAEWLPVVVERLIYHVTHQCWDAFRSGDADARVLVYPGGWSALAKAAGINSRFEHHVPGIVAALRSWKGVDGKQPAMIADYHIKKAVPGRRAEVRLLVGEGLVPGYAASLPKGDGRRLLPALPVPELQIPGVGKDRVGAMLSYRWELLAQLREMVSSEVVGVTEDGSILLPLALRRIASHKAGLEDQEADAVDRVWIGSGSGAWLRVVTGDWVQFVDTHAVELYRNAAEMSEGRRYAALAHPKYKKKGET